MSRVVYLHQNPSSPGQMYALWDTGRIDPIGGALPIFDAPEWFDTTTPPARAMYVTDWNGPAGYVLDCYGAFRPFGGADPVGSGDFPDVQPGVPFKGGITGVQTLGPPTYVDWSWNPDNSGQGYVCDYYGQLYAFGGATDWTGAVYTVPVVRRLSMQWAPFKRAVIVDYGGSRNQRFPSKQLALDGYYNASRDWVADMIVTDWGSQSPVVDPSGYLLIKSGAVFEWGPRAPQDAFGGPFVGNLGTQVTFARVQAANPLIMIQVAALGQQTVYTASTSPTVTAGNSGGMPPPVVVDTTRPQLAWSYSDPQNDSQKAWELLVFTQAFAAANTMTYPKSHAASAVINEAGTDTTTRGIVAPADLPNGAYRMYVRAQDTSGRWSGWANLGWTQDVPTPPAPTGLLASVDGFHVNLVLTTASVETGQLAVFESSDDGGATWGPVRGAEAVPLELTTYAVDWDIPLGVPRSYRARIYYTTPRSISAPSVERTVTVERFTFAFTSTEDPELGGEVFAYGSMGWTREVVAGVFEPLGAAYPIVITDGVPRSRRRTLTLRSASVAEWDRIAGLAESGHILLLREPFGESAYCHVVGSWSREQIRALPSGDGPQSLAHTHETDLPLVEVARPETLPPEDF